MALGSSLDPYVTMTLVAALVIQISMIPVVAWLLDISMILGS